MTVKEFNNLTVGSLIKQSELIYEILKFNKYLDTISIKVISPKNSIHLNEIYDSYSCFYLTTNAYTVTTEWHVIQIHSIYDELCKALGQKIC